MKNLNVVQTCFSEITKKWDVSIPLTYRYKELFVRCNAKGVVNWDKAPVYTRQELDLRGNYSVIIVLDMNKLERIIKTKIS